MKEFIKHNPATLDNVETMANAMIESMRFVDNTLDYPEAEKARPNDGVEPNSGCSSKTLAKHSWGSLSSK